MNTCTVFFIMFAMDNNSATCLFSKNSKTHKSSDSHLVSLIFNCSKFLSPHHFSNLSSGAVNIRTKARRSGLNGFSFDFDM